MLSTRTSGRTHSGHQPWEAGACLGSACAVIVGAATVAAEPIATALASQGRRRGTEEPTDGPDMGTTGVEDGQAGAGLDTIGDGMFWMLERDNACSAPPCSTAELEVAGSDVEGWGE